MPSNGGYWDVNGLNRQLFHSADIHKSFNLLFAACSLMKGSNDQQAREIKELIARNFLHPSNPSIQSIGTLSGAEIREYPAADGRMPAAYRQIVRSKNSYYREKRVRNCRTVAGDRADENSSPVESPLSVPVRFPSIYFPVLPLSVRHDRTK